MADLSVVLDEKVKQKVQEPRDWKVIMVNDDQTPMDFVVGLLTEIFKHNPQTAQAVMLQIHNEGSGIAGVYTFEIAEAKSVESTSIARSSGFPLQIKLEEA